MCIFFFGVAVVVTSLVPLSRRVSSLLSHKPYVYFFLCVFRYMQDGEPVEFTTVKDENNRVKADRVTGPMGTFVQGAARRTAGGGGGGSGGFGNADSGFGY
jgi:hypothetical protein